MDLNNRVVVLVHRERLIEGRLRLVPLTGLGIDAREAEPVAAFNLLAAGDDVEDLLALGLVSAEIPGTGSFCNLSVSLMILLGSGADMIAVTWSTQLL